MAVKLVLLSVLDSIIAYLFTQVPRSSLCGKDATVTADAVHFVQAVKVFIFLSIEPLVLGLVLLLPVFSSMCVPDPSIGFSILRLCTIGHK